MSRSLPAVLGFAVSIAFAHPTLAEDADRDARIAALERQIDHLNSRFALQDLKVVVYDGKHHSVDSKEVAFVSAGRKAFLDAVQKAGPAVLEPLIVGLKQKGFCFDTLRNHPDYKTWIATH